MIGLSQKQQAQKAIELVSRRASSIMLGINQLSNELPDFQESIKILIEVIESQNKKIEMLEASLNEVLRKTPEEKQRLPDDLKARMSEK
jgi:DNA gyrase/topoisomerase IV subunit A